MAQIHITRIRSTWGCTMTVRPIVGRLRQMRRGYKFLSVAISAWSPLLLATHPWAAGIAMLFCTAVFFIATRPSHSRKAIEPLEEIAGSPNDV